MALITVDRDLCARDSFCMLECPIGIIVPDADDFPTASERMAKYCIQCGHCAAVCPKGALILNHRPPDELTPLRKDLEITAQAATQFLKSRRSVRRWKDTPVPRSVLTRALDIARFAPSGHNKQAVQWLVYEDPAKTRRISFLIADGLRASGVMPGLIRAFDRGQDVILRNAPHLAIAHCGDASLDPATDSVIAGAYLDMAAHGLGLGACWCGLLVMAARDHLPLIQELGLPEGRQAYAALMLGYPAVNYTRIPLRKPQSVEWR